MNVGDDAGDNRWRLPDRRLAAMEASIDGIAILDEDRRYVYMNKAHARLYGYADSGELVGEKWDHFYDEAQRRWLEHHALPALAQEGCWRGEATGTRRDGSTFSQELSIAAIEGGSFVCVAHDITERKQTQEDLRSERNLLRTVVDSADDAIFVKDREHRFRLNNRAHQEILGAEGQKDLLGKTNADYWGEARTAPHHADDRRVLDASESVRGKEERITRAGSGEERWISTTKVPLGSLEGFEGKPAGLVAISRDITDKRRAEEALKKNEWLLREAQRVAGLGIWEWDLTSGEVVWSEEQCRIYGLEPHEFGDSVEAHFERVHLEDRELVSESLERTLHSAEPVEVENRITRPEGEVRVVYTRRQAIRDERGEPVKVVGTTQDITEQKRTEEVLRESETRFRSLVQNAPDIISLLDADSTILYDSPAIERILGYQAGERIGTRGIDYIHPADLERAQHTFEKILSNPGIGMPVEYRLRHKDGSWRHFEATRTNLLDDPAVGAIVLNYRDVTERKQVEETLRRQSEYLGALHETSLALIDRLELPDLLEAIVARAGALMGTSHGYVFLAEPGEPELEMHVGKGAFGKYSGCRLQSGECVPGRVFESGQPLVVDDYSAWEGCLPQFGQEEFRAVAGVPLKSGPEVVGVIGLAYLEEGRTFGSDEVDLLRRFAGIASVALDNARLYARIRRELAERKQAEEALRESEERHRAVMEQSTEAIWLFDPASKRVLESNAAFQELLDYTAEDLSKMTNYDFVAHSHEDVDATVARKVREGRESPVIERKYRRKDGTLLDVEVCGTVISYRGKEVVCSVARDLTERKRAEKALRESEERFRLLFEQSVDYLVVHDAAGKVVDVNAQTCRSLGYSRQEMLSMHVGDYEMNLISAREHEEQERQGGTLWQRIVASEPGAVSELHRGEHRRKDGTTFPVEVRVGGVLHRGERMILASSRDVTERKRLEDRLIHQALHDPLTALPNRTLLMDRLGQALSRADREGGIVAVLFLDLDNFKVINDSLGHEVGDRLLGAAASRLWECVRAGETAARLGGDEFAIVLEGLSSEHEAIEVARRVEERFRAPLVVDGHKLFVGTSIGIALSNRVVERDDELMRQADLAMYRAKSKGKGRYEVFHPAMDGEVQARLEMGNELRSGFERGEFELYYQPKVSVDSGATVAFETLLRWNHPKRGLLLPETFVRTLEEVGLIVPVGRWVLREACRQAREWHERLDGGSPRAICLNISAKQLEQSDLVQEVSEILEETGLEARYLALEITEGAFITEEAHVSNTLSRLKELGVKLVIDDFGIGYSSLSYLRRLPVDYLKIDRSFVEKLGREREETAIVRAIAQVSHALDIKVVAEGVESAEQLSQVREMGFDLAQGYYFAKPMPVRQVALYLETGTGGQ